MLSFPEPPFSVSFPIPPNNVSFPAPPKRLSLPPAPSSVLFVVPSPNSVLASEFPVPDAIPVSNINHSAPLAAPSVYPLTDERTISAAPKVSLTTSNIEST